MNKYSVCGNCKYFNVCIVDINRDICEHFESKKRSSVRPRRLCDFCELHKLIDDEYGRYKNGCMKLIPLPAINLTTGEKSDPKRNVEYSMFVYESDDDNGEVGSFPIKFCPYCGRKLGCEKDC